jgi:hypothetical protein
MRGLSEIVKVNREATERHATRVREDESGRLIRVMVQLLENELDYHGLEELQEHHPELRGIPEQRIREFLEAGKLFDVLFN